MSDSDFSEDEYVPKPKVSQLERERGSARERRRRRRERESTLAPKRERKTTVSKCCFLSFAVTLLSRSHSLANRAERPLTSFIICERDREVRAAADRRGSALTCH